MEEYSRVPNIEELIRRAMEQGEFDNLPGHGKPLNFEENPHEDPSWRSAYRLLKNSGFSLPWIETLKDIETELERARGDLARTWSWKQSSVGATGSREGAEEEWRRAVEAFRERIAAINRRIQKYNLEVPSTRFQRSRLNAEREIEQITGNAS
jgi:DnaJ family protein C protein 28